MGTVWHEVSIASQGGVFVGWLHSDRLYTRDHVRALPVQPLPNCCRERTTSWTTITSLAALQYPGDFYSIISMFEIISNLRNLKILKVWCVGKHLEQCPDIRISYFSKPTSSDYFIRIIRIIWYVLGCRQTCVLYKSAIGETVRSTCVYRPS